MKRRILLGTLVLCVLLLPAGGGVPTRAVGVLYVAPSASGSGDCSLWANACTLQVALDAATSGDEIWVAMGTHKPTALTNPGDPRTATFQLVSGVEVYGGFAGIETAHDQRNPAAHQTILSGDIGATGEDSDNCYNVVTGSGVDASAILDGFTISGGNANLGNSCPGACGGGMYNDSGSPSLHRVTFRHNHAKYGGGMGNWNSSPTLTAVTFESNRATTGGGMESEYSSPALTDVTFEGNSATSAAGMGNLGGSPTLANVTFYGNAAVGFAGGMNCSLCTLQMVNVAFVGNTASAGGGIYLWNSSSATLANVTMSNNMAVTQGGGLWNVGSNPSLSNCIVWDNEAPAGPQIFNDGTSTPSIAYCDIQGSGGSGGGWDTALGTDGGGNLDRDPAFRRVPDPGDGDWTTSGNNDYGDLRLQLTSPAIDAGDNTAVLLGVTIDLRGGPRFVDVPEVTDSGNGTPPIVDMGAYEALPYGVFLPLVNRGP